MHFFPTPRGGLWTRTFYDSTHAPVFGIVAFCIFTAAQARRGWSNVKRLVVTVVIVVLLSVLSEAAQIIGPRNASIIDLIADWLGAASALFAALALGIGNALGRPIRMLVAIVALTLGLFSVSSLIKVSAAFVERNSIFPTLISFEAKFGRSFRRTNNAKLLVLEKSDNSRSAAQLTLRKGAWPGVIFHDLVPNWSDFSHIVIVWRSADGSPLNAYLQIHDHAHNRGKRLYSDRFNREHVLMPDFSELRISLADVQSAPRNRLMDLTNMEGVVISFSSNDFGRKVEIEEIRLE